MMPTEWMIRPATGADDLVAIWRGVYEADHVPLLPEGVQAPFEPRGEAHVAHVEGLIIGFCYVDNDWLDEAWIVKPWQGRGVGTALIGYAEGLMRRRGIDQASLSVWGANKRAVALYRRLGWVELRTFISTTNAQTYIRMTKKL